MKLSIALGIVGVIIAILSPFIAWGTIKYTIAPYGPSFSEDIPGSLLYQPFALMLGFTLVAISTISSAINQEKQYLIRGIFLLTAGIIMLLPFLYGFHAFYWAQGVMEKYFELLGVPEAQWPEISIGFGVYLGLVGAIVTIVAGCISLTSERKAQPPVFPPSPP